MDKLIRGPKWLFRTALVVLVLGVIWAGSVAWDDSEADWKVRSMWFDASTFHADSVAATGGTGAPTKSNVTQGIGGFILETSDAMAFGFPIPPDIDLRWPLAARIMWSNMDNSAASGGVDWVLKFKRINEGSQLGLRTRHTGAVQDSIVFDADSTDGAQFDYEVTAWDTITAGTVRQFGAGTYIQTEVRLADDGDLTAKTGVCLGVEIAYVPHTTWGAPIRTKTVRIPGRTRLGVEEGITITRP